jgi:hypothetical protein
MLRDQTVFEMAEEVLARQARSLANRTGQPFDRALEIVADTEAGRQLRRLGNGEHRQDKAQHWQASQNIHILVCGGDPSSWPRHRILGPA